MKRIFLFTALALALVLRVQAETVSMGSGSYTTTFPGNDSAGRNLVPSGTPLLSGNAVGRPVPTNDWWSNALYQAQSENIFCYPIGLRTVTNGLSLAYIKQGAMVDFNPVFISVGSITSAATTVSDYTDWTVTLRWGDDTEHFEAIAGLAMPYVYFTKQSSQSVTVTVREGQGTVSVDGSTLIIANGFNGASFAIFAPEGSTWEGSGYSYTSSLNGKDYWSAAMLPQTATDITATAREMRQHAFVFPTDTRADYSYDASSATVRTDFKVTTDVKEGTERNMLIGLLPHHWAHLADDSAQPGNMKYTTIRGEMRILEGNEFSTVNTFGGILPYLPYVEEGASEGFSKDELASLASAVVNDHGLTSWTDSYNDGQLLNRLVQTAHIAKASGDEADFQTAYNLVKARVEDWLTYTQGEVAFLFYYNRDWSTLFGYPAGHGQDQYINDHHFHWGYFIHAAAFLEQYGPGWADEWGPMVNMLVRDVATTDRDDTMFPYLRNFSPYAGHCWANGVASLPQGNDQESSSESMQFHSALIHWALVTGNTALRDLGVYMYATEKSAIDEYWFDKQQRIFPDNKYCLVSRIFGNNYDNGTFWTADIAASYGIELYPIHGGSLYLASDQAYAKKLWNEIAQNTGVLSNTANADLWYDTMWQFLSLTDAAKAIELYNAYPDHEIKFGTSQALTYHWLHAMNALGRYDADITADYPAAAAFSKDGTTRHAAYNYSSSPLDVTFSDGVVLTVAARSMGIDDGTPTPDKPDVPDTPDTPDNPDDTGNGDGCIVESDELTEGAGMTYRLSFETTSDGSVTVTAEALTSVDGLVAYIRDLTNGFTEMQMTAVGNQKFTYTLTGYTAGQTISLACKFAWASGGIGVTDAFTYVVGSSCRANIEPVKAFELTVAPNPVSDRLTVKSDNGTIGIWDASGRLIERIATDGSATINSSAWTCGIYLLRFDGANGSTARRIIKK